MIRVRRVLIYIHRWLGISGGLLFITWFASGIVMMYVRMPELDSAERIGRLEPLDLSAIRRSMADTGGDGVDAVRINMLGGRPVYRVALGGGGIRTIYADSGELLAPLDRDGALAVARRFAPAPAAALR